MTRRTPLQSRRLEAFAEREMLRELAQTVRCRDCEVPAGERCVNAVGEPLAKVDHASRLKDAELVGRANE